MDEIIANFTPLVNEEIERKRRQYEENRTDLKKLKSEVSQHQNLLKRYNAGIRIEAAKADVLNKVQYLYDSNVLYGENKQTVKKILDEISTVKVGSPLDDMKKRLDRMIKLNIKKIKEG